MTRDEARLRAQLSTHKRRFVQASEMIDAHLDAHSGHVAWSGGKDSTAVAELAHSVRPGVAIVTYVAGTEYPEVLPYCAEVADRRGWRWETIQTGDVTDMLDRGVEPSSGGQWWDAMIAGPARVAHDRYGPGLLWGLRAEESDTRAVMLRSTRGVHARSDGVTTCAPIWRWDTIDVWAVLASAGIPACPVYSVMERIGMPAEQRRVGRIVGRRSMQSRMAWLARGWPSLHAEYVTRWPWLADAEKGMTS